MRERERERESQRKTETKTETETETEKDRERQGETKRELILIFMDAFSIKLKFFLTCRSNVGSRLFRTSCFQDTLKNIEVQKIFEKYQPLNRAKVS